MYEFELCLLLFLFAVFQIRNIFVWIRMQIWILSSIPLRNGSGSKCGPVPKSSVTVMDAKKSIFSYFFCFNKEIPKLKIGKICLMIKITFLARKILYWNFILQPLFQSAQHFYEKWEGSRSILVTNGFGCLSGRPNKIQIPGCRSGILIIWVLDSKSLRSNKISNIYSGVG